MISQNCYRRLQVQVHFGVRLGCVILCCEDDLEGFCK